MYQISIYWYDKNGIPQHTAIPIETNTFKDAKIMAHKRATQHPNNTETYCHRRIGKRQRIKISIAILLQFLYYIV